MPERRSPAVMFPLQGAGVLAGGACCVAAVLAVVLIVWLVLGAGEGQAWWLRCAAAGAVWFSSVYLAWRRLSRMPEGTLHWNGKQWRCESLTISCGLLHPPQVVCDCGWAMALVWRTENGQRMHMWVQRNWSAAAWLDLRRAVYLPAFPLRVAGRPDALL